MPDGPVGEEAFSVKRARLDSACRVSSREAGPDCLPVAESARNRCDGRIRSSSIEALTVTGTASIRTAKKGPRYTPFGLSLAEQVTRPSVRTCAAAHFSPLRAYPFVGCSNFCLLG